MKPALLEARWGVNPPYVLTGRGQYVNWHRDKAPVRTRRKIAARGNGLPEKDAASGELSKLTATTNRQASIAGQGRRLARKPVRRTLRVEFTLTDEEYAVLVAAAGRAGLARGAYAAQAALAAAANGTLAGYQGSLRQALIELMRAAGLVRRIGTNLNQAVAKLNATGQPTGHLPAYAAENIRHADHIDAVADAVRKALRRRSW